ncbi:hypothetical protein SDC9_108923 [bioreactor metagenome]|uniref:Tripartite tricarboxylate transporter family receptor n=1 Tax=bioreactor metagenome TaxID=1076179 RepID=A0A645B9I1_9ZZZZ
MIVENRPGASGMIGTSTVVKGPKDGSNLVFASVSLVTAAAVSRNVPFDISKDLVPVAITGEGPLLIVVPSQSPIKTPADLVAAARAKPLTHGSAGVGTIVHLAAELLNGAAKTQFQHIPYKGAAPAVTDTIGGTLDVMFAANTTFSAQIASGRMRTVAVTSAQPSPAFPNVPTMASVVPGYSATLWNVLFAPAGTPPQLLQILNREVNEISKSKDMVDLMQMDGFVPKNLTLEQASKQVHDAYTTWKALAKERNISLD